MTNKMTSENCRRYELQYVTTVKEYGLICSELVKHMDFDVNNSCKVYINKEKVSFVGKNDTAFRVSFNTKKLTKAKKVSLYSDNVGTGLEDTDKFVMKIQSDKKIPVWLTKMLDYLGSSTEAIFKYATKNQKYVVCT